VAERFDETKLAAARLRAIEFYPFLGVALYALSPVDDPGRGTFAVDERWRLYVDPGALEAWTVEEVAGVLLHEVSHVVRFHADRARAVFVDDETSLRWNLAADAEINDDLVADGVPLPRPVTPSTLQLPRHRAAEFYFERLMARSDPSRWRHVDCGEGAHSLPSGREGDDLPPGLAPDEATLLRRQVALAVLAGRQAGQDAGGWSRWAESFLRPVVDWRRQFGACIRGALSEVISGRTDYRYGRPSRRRVPNVVLPSLVRPVPTVAVVIDTSGSVADAELSRAWSEVLGMMRSAGVRRERLQVWSTDTTARRLDVRPGERIELIGGGGTDMAEGIRAALAGRPTPDIVVVLTDGETPWPSVRPSRPVIVGLFRPEGEYHAPPPPPWATVVEVPVDA
jgi:predicted metal-dependent peptidase